MHQEIVGRRDISSETFSIAGVETTQDAALPENHQYFSSDGNEATPEGVSGFVRCYETMAHAFGPMPQLRGPPTPCERPQAVWGHLEAVDRGFDVEVSDPAERGRRTAEDLD